MIRRHGSTPTSTIWSTVYSGVVGGLFGGLLGAAFAVAVTDVIKRMLAVVSRQDTWIIITTPLVGLALAVAVLHTLSHGEATQEVDVTPAQRKPPRFLPTWRAFPADVARADLTADVVATSGQEERFPWRLAPVRGLAVIATVGLGAPMGTEAPAAHFGVAAGAFLGERARWMRRHARPASLAGGAAAVSALMGIPLVGAVFMLELGRRRRTPVDLARIVPALVGGVVGWTINVAFDLSLIRLAVPRVPPEDLIHVLGTVVVVGAVSGAVASLTGAAIYRARAWTAPPATRLIIGGLAAGATAIALTIVASPAAAIGPGSGAVAWSDTTETAWTALIAVALLRAVATTAAVAAGGCGGVFVPFLAIGDVSGRAFAPALGISGDLAGAAGAAGGIAGGYRLPWTAVAMVVGVGGPSAATLTCLATVGVAAFSGVGTGLALDRLTARRAVPEPAAA